LFRLGDVGERLGFRRGGGSGGQELMTIHRRRLKRSTREGESELWGSWKSGVYRWGGER
jgi:hypothetical protein